MLNPASPRPRSQSLRLERSPRRYSRHDDEIDHRILTGGKPVPLGVSRLSRPNLQSFQSSESGTEGDDEKIVYKALPAPQLRARKGLRDREHGSISDESYSPVSPTDAERKVLLVRHNAPAGAKTVPTQLSDRAVEKKRKQWRMDLARRLLEAGLLLWLTSGSLGVDTISWTVLRNWKNDPALIVIITAALYHLIYSLGKVIRSCRRTSIAGVFLILASTPVPDPAPYLYPLLLPLAISAQIDRTRGQLWLWNSVLGLSALPSRNSDRDTTFRWLLSLSPIFIGKFMQADDLKLDYGEQLSLLYPLHQSLVPTLTFLTTTSLLTTEVQLLSITLINLYGFSTSPQATILKSLLWYGGLMLFIACRHNLRWTVSLARVPRWRFRKSYSTRFSNNSLVCALDDTLNGLLSRRAHKRKAHRSLADRDEFSDSESDTTMAETARSRRSNGVHGTSSSDRLRISRSATVLPFQQRTTQRRHTFSSAQTLPEAIATTVPALLGSAGHERTRTQLMLSLTKAQVTVLTWLSAFYTYAFTVLAVLGPLRYYIGWKALNNYEAVGWALGYLFGNIPSFRLQVVMLNLEYWIPLPPRFENSTNLGRVDHLREIAIGAANVRLLIACHCVLCIVLGLIVVFSVKGFVEVDTRRKVFHGMVVAMFLPTIFIDPSFIALAMVLVLAVFLLLDLFRASQLPPISRPLTLFLAPYVDGRDHKGPVIVSHIFLLIGCAIPLWLSLASVDLTGFGPLQGWEVATRDLSMVSGVLCVGLGDAAASLVGRRYGRHRWPWGGGKSLEGSAAFAVAVFIGLNVSRLWLHLGQWMTNDDLEWMAWLQRAVLASTGASLTEALLTGGNDNVIVPVVLWLFVKTLGL